MAVHPGRSRRAGPRPTSRPKPTGSGSRASARALSGAQMFCRLKDFRRVATRYDRLATNYLAAVCFAATVSYWL